MTKRYIKIGAAVLSIIASGYFGAFATKQLEVKPKLLYSVSNAIDEYNGDFLDLKTKLYKIELRNAGKMIANDVQIKIPDSTANYLIKTSQGYLETKSSNGIVLSFKTFPINEAIELFIRSTNQGLNKGIEIIHSQGFASTYSKLTLKNYVDLFSYLVVMTLLLLFVWLYSRSQLIISEYRKNTPNQILKAYENEIESRLAKYNKILKSDLKMQLGEKKEINYRFNAIEITYQESIPVEYNQKMIGTDVVLRIEAYDVFTGDEVSKKKHNEYVFSLTQYDEPYVLLFSRKEWNDIDILQISVKHFNKYNKEIDIELNDIMIKQYIPFEKKT